MRRDLTDRLPEVPGLVEACDDERLFGVELTARQRALLAELEAGGLLHVWALGRRSGKTLLSTLVALWFCTLRPDLARFTRRRERRYAVTVATNARQARINVRQAREVIENSPFLSKLVDSVTDDEITFKLTTSLAAFPCTSRGGRGWPVMFVAMDEAAHFVDGDGNQAAEPVFRALAPSVAQFGDQARLVVASSPYGVDGWFADLFGTVEKGDLESACCAQAGTLAMRPDLATAALELERARDPEAFRAEYEAEFVAAGGAFMDAGRVAEAVGRSGELAAGSVSDPVAAVDLAFTSDSSALCIVGRDKADGRRLRLVLARSWSPQPGRPLSFSGVLDEIADVCLAHGVRRVLTDQFNAASAREHLERRGLQALVVTTTASSKSAAFADLKARLYEGRLELYDHEGLLAELRRVETATTPGQATIRIRRLGASHGDLATALALACSRLREPPKRARTFVARGRIPGPEDRFGVGPLAGWHADRGMGELAGILRRADG